MHIVCFIEARMRSTRLPGKVLMPILGRPMLERMIERLRRVRIIDGIVATTDQDADDPIAALSEEIGVGCFRGSEDDVLARELYELEVGDAPRMHGIIPIAPLCRAARTASVSDASAT